MKSPIYATNLLRLRVCIFSCACFFLLPLLSHAQRQLVWEENFNTGTALNPDVWTYETGDGCAKGNCGWGNAELEYYTSRPENVRIENGSLVIEARHESMGGKPFTSARIKTAGRVSFRYGALEARIKVPQVGNGLWPAFWLLGATGGTWPHNGEVDILEMGFAGAIAAGRVNRTASAATHWWTENPGGYTGHASYAKDTTASVDLNNDFHLYRLEWDPQFITIFLDNQPYYKIDISVGNGLDAFQNPFYILLNLAVGGNYPGIPNESGVTAPLPGRMEIDYLKLYQDPAQGEELLLGTNNAPEGNYGIFTDNTPVNDKVVFGQGADLFLWNNITAITPAPAPYEGSNGWAFHANAGNWFGLGVANDAKNMRNFAGGSLKFHMKTTSPTAFKVGIATDGAEGWVNFTGSNEHGLVRDGQWHEVTIPVSEFGSGLDLMQVTQLFMFSGDAPAAAADFYFDNIYYTGGVSDNPAPTVAITNLANDTVFTTPAAINIQTNASDPNGSIAKVEFFNGTKLIGSKTTAPFNFTWNTSTPGIVQLAAKATDNQGKITTSKPVTVLITAPGNTAPQVSISSPTAGTPYRQPAKVTISANVTDDGDIYKVEFYNGATLLGTLNKAPYNFTWENVNQGSYTLTVKATDNGKLSTTSAPVTITVQDNVITADKYGVYSEDASITDKLTYGLDANLYVWNNLGTIAGATPQEGTEVMAFTAAANNWFGLGVANDVRDLSHFSNGYLKFSFKTSYGGSFRFSVISGSGQTDISFAAGEQKYGLVRDGQWHEVTIPVSDLTGTNMSTVTQAFTFSGDAPAAAASFYIDNVYYTTPNAGNNQPNLALNKPTTTSDIENIAFEGKYAVDGDPGTRWSSAFSDPQWIVVDLGADYNINRVKLSWETAAGKDYLVQVSNDANSWSGSLKTVTGNTALTNDWTGLSGHGRYLRIYGTARTTPYGYSLFELEAYGSLHSSAARSSNIAATGVSSSTSTHGRWQAGIYPNPVAGSQLQLRSSEALRQVRIIGINGRSWSTQLSQEGKLNGTYPIDVSRLPAGMYLLELMNKQHKRVLLKFIKQ